ncbi:flagellar biosynthetic protein FliO [Aquabacter sediminis]|uniref:flagellar biosynthetic protein FliO n=1 Tax=Aquabacter sediminis TaxID=3029197 RepID=UPI00237E5730|nr:flagellar biosynthetic protein FliO [Aquabacter sp. P-9]MDE1567777.1 flagellar biosynthetic protein FliO [Aquabacter sp. P-9]
MLQDLLGTHLELPVRLAIAAVVIVVLLGLTVLIVRALSGRGRGPGGRSRQARLAVMDSVPVDQRRRLILVRRDDVEHLLLIGGNRDLVVEPSIPRGLPREQTQTRDALPLREAGRDALAARETTLLRRTAAAPPLMAPPPAGGTTSEPSPQPSVGAAMEPLAPKPPAAPEAAPSTPGSRFAALRRPTVARPEGDLASRAGSSSESPSGVAAASATAFTAAKRVFESRTSAPKAPEARTEERTVQPKPPSVPAPDEVREAVPAPAEPEATSPVEVPVAAHPEQDLAKDALPGGDSHAVRKAEPAVTKTPVPAAELVPQSVAPVAEPPVAEPVAPPPILAQPPLVEPPVKAPFETATPASPAAAEEDKAEPMARPVHMAPIFEAKEEASASPAEAREKVEPTFHMPAAPVADSRPVDAAGKAQVALSIEDLLGPTPESAPLEDKIEPKVEMKAEAQRDSKVEPTLGHQPEAPAEHHVEPKVSPRIEPQIEFKVEPVAPAPTGSQPSDTPAAPARRAPVFSFGRPGREAPARAEPKLGDRPARLQTSLEKALEGGKEAAETQPVQQRRPVEPPAGERQPRPTASFPPTTFASRPTAPPVPPFVPPPAKPGAPRPTSPFRAAPLPPEVVATPAVEPDVSETDTLEGTDRMDSHAIGSVSQDEGDAPSEIDSAPPVRVIEPEPAAAPSVSPDTFALIEMEAGLNLETDLMRELEITLAQELSAPDAGGEESIAPQAETKSGSAPHQAAAEPAQAGPDAAVTDAESEKPDATASTAPSGKAAATVDPFEDLEAEMASLLGRAPPR